MHRFLVYTDPHWSQYSSILRRRGNKYSVRLENLIESMNWLETFASQNGCEDVISCGDFFDKESLNCEEISALQDVNWNLNNHSFIVGNHESNVSSLEFSSTKFFESIGANVYDTIQRRTINDYVDFYFIPYLTDDHLPKLADIVVDKTKKNVIFAHLDIAGLQYGKYTSQAGMDIEDILGNCTLFLDGHLHNGQTIQDKIVLIGNLTGQNFNEDALKYEHLVYLLTVNDDGTIILDAIENPHAINFYKLKIDSLSDLTIFDNLKQNSVVSVICNNNIKDQVLNKIQSSDKILEFRLNSIYGNSFEAATNSVIAIKVDHIQQFIDLANTKFEPSPALTDELMRLRGV